MADQNKDASDLTSPEIADISANPEVMGSQSSDPRAGHEGPLPPSPSFPDEMSLSPGSGDSPGDDPDPVATRTTQAYDVLLEALKLLRARGRKTTAAGINSEMKRLTAGGFDHRQFGFDTFRDFLGAAERQGLVALWPPPPGSQRDVEVLPPGTTPSPAAVSAGIGSKQRRIRSDLWTAFVDWSPDRIRIFDASGNRAYVLTLQPRPMEPEEVQTIRERWQADPTRFIEIPPIPQDQQLRWMRQFVDELDDDSAKALLATAMNTLRPHAAFAAVVRGLPAIAERWRRRHLESVKDVVENWMNSHGIKLDFNERETSPGSGSSAQKASTSHLGFGKVGVQSTGIENADAERLRRHILDVLACLPLSELLRLRIPIEYLLER